MEQSPARFAGVTIRRISHRLTRATLFVLLAVAAMLCAGCQTPQRPIAAPARHSIRSEQLLVLSDFKIEKEHPLIQDLIALRGQVSETLALPMQKEEVVVYLFSNEGEYHKYLDAAYPGLPRRRAYFVGTPRELAVYTYWGDRIQEDLRHEYTHGLLHACLKNVPLWIDEGLAEYFEVAGPKPGTVNSEYAQRLAASLANGWRPDMQRLEKLDEFSQMQRIDYQEAWSWVHYMLHTTPESKQALLSYLADLQHENKPHALSARLAQADPHVSSRILGYLASLNMSPMWSGQARVGYRPNDAIDRAPEFGESAQGSSPAVVNSRAAGVASLRDVPVTSSLFLDDDKSSATGSMSD